VKKGYVPPEEQQTYDRWKNTEPAGVPGAGDVHVPPKPQSKSAAKNAKRKAKKGGENDAAPAAEETRIEGGAVDVSEPTAGAAPAAAPTAAEADAAGEGKKAMLEKKVRALRKKLKGVEELEAKMASGVELNEDQKSKVAGKAEIEAEITRWGSLGDVDELGKEVKKLGKKLRQIEELEAKAAEGEVLNADQQGKVANKKKLADELKTLEELAAQLSL